jgi:acyl carrier protein
MKNELLLIVEASLINITAIHHMNTCSNETFDQIKAFVVEQRWEYDFVLTRKTELRKDLKIWGDDATDFILAFGKAFNVDLSKMDLDKYFPPEGNAFLSNIIRLLILKKAPTYLSLTLGDLEEAVKTGRLE